MLDKRAVIVGTGATILITLLSQLIFVLVASAIGNAGTHYHFLATYKHEVWLTLGMLTHWGVMVMGGAITAFAAKNKQAAGLAAAIVGAGVSGLSLLVSVGEDEFTLMSIVVVVTGGLFAAIGARLWGRLTTAAVEQSEPG